MSFSLYEMRAKPSVQRIISILEKDTLENWSLYLIIFFWVVTQVIATQSYFGVQNPSLKETYFKFWVIARFVIVGIIVFKYRHEELFTGIAVVAVVAAVEYITWRVDGWNIYEFVWFFAASKDTSIDRCVKAFLWGSVVSIMLTVSASLMGVIPNELVVKDEATSALAFGYIHPNELGGALVSVTVAYLVLCNSRMSIRKLVLPIACAIFTLFFLRSKASSICIVFLVMACVSCTEIVPQIIREKFLTIIKKGRWLVVVCSVVVVAIAVLPVDVESCNTLFSRVHSIHSYCRHFGINFFGNPYLVRYVAPNGDFLYSIDNAYYHLLHRGGLANLLLLNLAYFFGIKRAYKEGKYICCATMTVLLLYGMVEAYLVVPVYNSTLFIIYSLFWAWVSERHLTREAAHLSGRKGFA